jgi:AraC-like DNA-binding protein
MVKNESHIWQIRGLPTVEFFKATYTDFSYMPHFHEEYAIGVVENGLHGFRYRGVNYKVPPQNIITCQPGEIHTGHSESDELWQWRMLYIQPTLIQEILTESGQTKQSFPFLKATVIEHPLAVQHLATLHQQAEHREPTLTIEIQLRQLLKIIVAHYSDTLFSENRVHQEKQALQRVKSYIQVHYAEDIQLSDLAECANFSKTYLIRAFRQQEGISPYAYLVQVRLKRAQIYLRQGYSILDTALATGFFDQSHFTRYFKATFGVTPRQYQTALG